MAKSGRVGWALGLALWIFFGGATTASAANVDLASYMFGTLGRWNRFTYTVPSGYPSFTVTLTKVGSGNFAGKYRIGDYLTPDPSKNEWFIFDYTPNQIYLYATDQGTFDTPVTMPRFMPLETLVNHPFESGFYWYFKILPSYTVPAGTFTNVLVWIVLDGLQPANTVNYQLGIPPSINYGVTAVDWYAPQVGDLKSLDVDAASGNTNFAYQLAAHGVKKAAVLNLLLE